MQKLLITTDLGKLIHPRSLNTALYARLHGQYSFGFNQSTQSVFPFAQGPGSK